MPNRVHSWICDDVEVMDVARRYESSGCAAPAGIPHHQPPVVIVRLPVRTGSLFGDNSTEHPYYVAK